VNETELVLVAHGTRDPRGVATVHELAAALRVRGAAVHVAFVDVLGPTVAEVLAKVAAPVVLVPAFLAAGYHVRADVPGQIRDSGRQDVRVTPALGPDAVLAAVQHARLAEAGWQRGDAVVLAAVGSADPRALDDVAEAAVLLSEVLDAPVRHGYAVAAGPGGCASRHTCWRPACSTPSWPTPGQMRWPTRWACTPWWWSWCCSVMAQRWRIDPLDPAAQQL